METKKYKLDESKDFNGKTLFRVVALISFGSVSAGDVGGWIEKESNLSHYGNAWVWDDAQVWGDAQVWDNAQVWGDAQVWGNAQVWDNAQVWGDARVWGYAQVWGDAQVWDNAQVWGDARVLGYARVSGDARVSKLAQTLRTEKYHITISDTHIQIGCKNYTFEEWENFDDQTISKMDNGALEWWKMYKPIIFSIIKAEGKM